MKLLKFVNQKFVKISVLRQISGFGFRISPIPSILLTDTLQFFLIVLILKFLRRFTGHSENSFIKKNDILREWEVLFSSVVLRLQYGSKLSPAPPPTSEEGFLSRRQVVIISSFIFRKSEIMFFR